MKFLRAIALLTVIVLLTTSCDEIGFFYPELLPHDTDSPAESSAPSFTPDWTSTPEATEPPTEPPATSATPDAKDSGYSFNFTKEDLLPSLDETLALIDYPKITATERFLESGTFTDIGAYTCYCYVLGDFTYLYLYVDPNTGKVMQIALTMMIVNATQASRDEYTYVFAYLAGFIEYEDYGAAIMKALDIVDTTKSKTAYAQGKYGNFWYNNDSSRADLVIRKVINQ